MSPKEFSLRKVFEVIADAIRPDLSWPESELPLIRHRPMADDSDLEFFSDLRYLEALADVIEDRCEYDGMRLPDFPQIESQAFWANWAWEDEALVLLVEWKMERHGELTGDGVGFAW